MVDSYIYLICRYRSLVAFIGSGDELTILVDG